MTLPRRSLTDTLQPAGRAQLAPAICRDERRHVEPPSDRRRLLDGGI